MDPIVAEGRNCWKIDACERATVIIDAADYYHWVQLMMRSAKRRILVIGWDFDSRIRLGSADSSDNPTLGEFFLELARDNPQRQIAILKWSFGALKQLLRPSALWILYKWYRTKAIDFRFDSAHPKGCSHHQKIVVIDRHLAVCGGIDISTARWDTSDHLDNDERRRLPDGKHYAPWHDITMAVAGPVAQSLAELGGDRWSRATRKALPEVDVPCDPVWPQGLPVMFEQVKVAIARTRAEYGTAGEIREIEELYLDMIASAKRFVYFENQYFTSAKLAAAIAKRLSEEAPPEFVLIMPRQADGWLEQKAMDAARIRLARQIAQVDQKNRFRIYVPVTQAGADIYVHAKLSIVDDRLVRVGSSNLNNRSLGLDSECDLVIDAALPGNEAVCQKIAALRARLLAEHLGVTPATFAREYQTRSSLVGAIEALRSTGKTLALLDLVEPGPLDQFIADSELLDPESADMLLDPIGERGLHKHWREGLRKMSRRRRRWRTSAPHR